MSMSLFGASYNGLVTLDQHIDFILMMFLLVKDPH